MEEKNLFGYIGLVPIRKGSVYWKASVDEHLMKHSGRGRASWAGAVGSASPAPGWPPCQELVAHSPPPPKGWLCLVPGFQWCCPHILCQERIETMNCPESLCCFPHSTPVVQLEISLSQPARPCACPSWLAESTWGTSNESATKKISQPF